MFRERPHWYALTFEYGLACAVSWQLVEDLLHGQWRVSSGDFYPWRRALDLSASQYFGLVSIEAVALVMFFLRIRPRWCAATIAVTLFLDDLGSHLNHRLLMSIEFLAVSLLPAPEPQQVTSYRERKVYWNLDIVRFQVSLVYFAAATHKLNEEFMSGRTLHNLFWMTHNHHVKQYPPWLLELLLRPDVCAILAWLTIGTEFVLAFGLNFRRTVGACLLLAVVLHLSMAVLMAYIKLFAFQVLCALVVFVPDHTFGIARYRLVRRTSADGPCRLLHCLWPGYIEDAIDPHSQLPWKLVRPDGVVCSGYDAWIELLSLSPLTLTVSEILRFGRPLGTRTEATDSVTTSTHS